VIGRAVRNIAVVVLALLWLNVDVTASTQACFSLLYRKLICNAFVAGCEVPPDTVLLPPLPQAELGAIEGLYDKYFRATVHDRW